MDKTGHGIEFTAIEREGRLEMIGLRVGRRPDPEVTQTPPPNTLYVGSIAT